ncbi:MAG: PIN domain-containing protein [Cyanobacteria bacterium REEB65]|nr:PIN domain-containing protein [Cyanobacteria bacterium REEB65]
MDSSGFLASVDRNDPAHERAKTALSQLQQERAALFSTNFIRAEAHALLGIRVGWDFSRRWLQSFDLPIERILPEDEEKARQLILAHNDKTYSYVDATSFVVMTRLGIRCALTLDGHFAQAGFETLP